MKTIQPLPIKLFKQRVRYNPQSGEFLQLRIDKHGNERGWFITAVKPRKKNYATISIKNKTYLAHRVAFALHHGISKFGIIDHKDGNGMNNKIENLREVTNGYNIYLGKRKKTKGVYYNKKTKFWESYINYNGKRKYLGIFRRKMDAVLARKDAELFFYNDSGSSISS